MRVSQAIQMPATALRPPSGLCRRRRRRTRTCRHPAATSIPCHFCQRNPSLVPPSSRRVGAAGPRRAGVAGAAASAPRHRRRRVAVQAVALLPGAAEAPRLSMAAAVAGAGQG